MLMPELENNLFQNFNEENTNATPSVNKKYKTAFLTFIQGHYVLDISQITDRDAIYFSKF